MGGMIDLRIADQDVTPRQAPTKHRIDVMRRVGYQIHVIAAVCAPCLASRQDGTEDLKSMRALLCLESYYP